MQWMSIMGLLNPFINKFSTETSRFESTASLVPFSHGVKTFASSWDRNERSSLWSVGLKVGDEKLLLFHPFGSPLAPPKNADTGHHGATHKVKCVQTFVTVKQSLYHCYFYHYSCYCLISFHKQSATNAVTTVSIVNYIFQMLNDDNFAMAATLKWIEYMFMQLRLLVQWISLRLLILLLSKFLYHTYYNCL